MLSSFIDIEGLQFGVPVGSEGLTIIPMLSAGRGSLPWLTLDEALAAKTATVTEISEGGSVPQLLFRNDGEAPVLLLDGEELIGAKQNRILNLTILAPPKEEIHIPVSCVERGRWSWRSAEFRAADRTAYAKLRARKADHVSESMSRGGGRHSNQHEIWADISDKAASMQAFSATEAVDTIYDSKAADLDRILAGLVLSADQTGAVFIVNGRFAGVELFGAALLFAKVFPKIARGYALDAIEERVLGRPFGTDGAGGAKGWFQSLLLADPERQKAIGLGEDLRFSTPAATGGALTLASALVHLYAFSRDYACETRTQRPRPAM